MKHQFTCTSPNRLDKTITSELPNFSRNFIAQLIKNGHVQLDNQIITKPSHHTRVGDIIIINPPPATSQILTPKDDTLDIVYEDLDILVINKPPFLPIHPSLGHANDTLVNILIHHYPDFQHFEPINGIHRPGIVHRLDIDTSGLIIIAKNQTAMKILAENLKQKLWTKKYQAIILNNTDQSRGVITTNIIRNPHNRKKFTTTHLNRGKTAITHYQIIRNTTIDHQQVSLIDITLETGRTHQIRVHLTSNNMPILGDKLYFSKESQKLSKSLDINRQLLHSYYLRIIHPTTNQPIEFQIDLPKDFNFFKEL